MALVDTFDMPRPTTDWKAEHGPGSRSASAGPCAMHYPVLGIHPKGFLQYLAGEEHWEYFPFGFISMYLKRRDRMVFYDRDAVKWRLHSLSPCVRVSFLKRLFMGGRPIRVSAEFTLVGPYEAHELRSALKGAVLKDDDILTQYHDAKTVLKWLDDATSVGKPFNAYRWFTKEFPRSKSPPKTFGPGG